MWVLLQSFYWLYSVGLGFDAAKGDALFFGFDHPGSLAVHIQQIVGKAMAGFEREFADGHATRGVDVGSGGIEDMPACRLQQHIDISPRLLFRL